MRATILVTATPYGSQAVLKAMRSDLRFTRSLSTYGAFQAVGEIRAKDHADLLKAIETVNDVPAQIASETLLDMEVAEERGRTERPLEGKVRALLLVDEQKDQGCERAHTLFRAIEEHVPGVEVAYPLLGRFDDAVWVRARDLAGLDETVSSIEAMAGVRQCLALVGRPA